MENNKQTKINIDDIANDLWASCDELRGNISSEQYMHIIIGIIFLKTISDKYNYAINALKDKYKDKFNDSIKNDSDLISEFFPLGLIVPDEAHWNYISGFTTDSSIGEKIDQAFLKIENQNPRLKGLFNKQYNSPELDKTRLGNVVRKFNDYDFSQFNEDLVGRIYEYFLGEFFRKQGQKGGEFYTPKTVVELLIDILDPNDNIKMYDPACGTGGMFVQARNYLHEQNKDYNKLVIYGQEYQSQTWKLAKINLLLNGFNENDIHLGRGSEDTFKEDLHKGQKFDIIVANPPFNLKKWYREELLNDERFSWGMPPENNANYAWLLHIISKLNSRGKAGVILANGSLSSSNKEESLLRKKMIEENIVDAIISLPDKLFYTTQISASIWFFNKNKENENVLFIEASKMGELKTKKLRFLTKDDISKIKNVYDKHEQGEDVNVVGFAKTCTIDEIIENDYSLVPGRYVGFEQEVIDHEQLNHEIKGLQEELSVLFDELEDLIPQAKESIKKVLEK
ncbi:type I restriction-modification system subunit M [Ureaplasma urealyticum]|uniref:site-specific DNA-methyltransferase (adenine-specific) n=2 Tax=Ureaplasma urealyticum TaxID=2130 RepID=A0AAP9A9H0_UREUR|nr:class I SAM-dependent DNA methyltransferase [Ureaplasma urealyticum]EDX54206.1 type I restriction-modification system, M subunit [Ureaplasma urealyticum serovar 9 str. ATCC 33175]EDT49765.1 HsdM [Ureaplasma urealyticum serovar 13 str. ATCC 33698]EDU06425.1 HsdM [Ureaplasma urealyticum serovar 5 str. ATCC 27817]EDU56707.1 HsdM [Ureaplasma urealyticum serovar 7 str. ATCC 27819]EDU67221.1 type I restriction-modification system, M subunit [Ureaplasma urealyticum serovar 11 str. ATCC 33695]